MTSIRLSAARLIIVILGLYKTNIEGAKLTKPTFISSIIMTQVDVRVRRDFLSKWISNLGPG